MNDSLYNEEYYKSCCGTDYANVKHWESFFGNIADCIIKDFNPKSVLDAGCAWGYLVSQLRKRGVEAYGIDISDYAISMVPEEIKPFCFVGSLDKKWPDGISGRFDLITNIEVLEHLHEGNGFAAIKNLCEHSDRIIFSSTPSDITEKTHYNVQQIEYWSKQFAIHGFYRVFAYDCSYLSPQAFLVEKQNIQEKDIVENYERELRITISDKNTITAERDGLAVERVRLTAERDRLAVEWNRLTAERDGLLNSRSWRFTKPLRDLAAFVRRHKALRLFAKGLLSLKRNGIRETIKKINNKIKSDYLLWIELNEPTSIDLKLQKKHSFSYRPKISIVIPMYNTSPYYFKKLLSSVKTQTYNNWELCLADGSPKRNKKIETLCAKNKRIHYRFLGENKGISGNTNEAIKLAAGDYIAFMDHDDTLAPFALYENVKYINEKPDVEFIYSDEDHLVDNKRHDPYIKPDFAPDTLRSWNYICHFVVMKRSLTEYLGELNSKYDGAQDYDYVLRASEATAKIYHIRKILYHWRRHKSSISKRSIDPFLTGLMPIQDHIERLGLKGTVKSDEKHPGYFHVIYDVIGNPSVSIVIPNKDYMTTLKTCVDSILGRSTYSNYEIVIVENNSENEETFTYYRELEKHPKIRVLY
jgi:glycosyltransferase involved in cell wall biosynthesis